VEGLPLFPTRVTFVAPPPDEGGLAQKSRLLLVLYPVQPLGRGEPELRWTHTSPVLQSESRSQSPSHSPKGNALAGDQLSPTRLAVMSSWRGLLNFRRFSLPPSSLASP
jgi:hypothetical protein